MPHGMVDGTSPTGRANLAAWRDAVRAACRDWLEEHPQQPLDEPVSVAMMFRFPLPSSDPYRLRHATAPDASKVARSTEDALVQGGLLKDDRLIWRLNVSKTYAQEGEPIGCDVSITPEGWREAHMRSELKKRAKEAKAAARNAARAS